MATHSSTLAWEIPWTEEPGRLQSMGSLRVGHNWATSLSLFTFMHWRRKWQPTLVFLSGESQGRGRLWAAIYGVTQSRTRQKWLSSSSSIPQCNYKNKKEKEVKIEAFFSPLFQIECNYYMTDMEAQWYLGLSLLQSSCSKIHNMQLSSYGLKIAVPSHSVISVW